MPLPQPTPPLVSAPRWAGVGLRSELLLDWQRIAMPDWPEDWWQRNYDTIFYEVDQPGWTPASERSLRIPGWPYPEVTPP